MNSENLVIKLIPSLNAISKELEYDMESSESMVDAALFAQGYYIDEMEVEPGETFKISEKFERGDVLIEEVKYKVVNKLDKFSSEFYFDIITEHSEGISLGPGNYRFNEDGITIEVISRLDFNDIEQD